MTWHQNKVARVAPPVVLMTTSILTFCLVILPALASQEHLQNPHMMIHQPFDELLHDDSQHLSVDKHAKPRSKRHTEAENIRPGIHDIALDHHDMHHLYWRVDYQSEEVRFDIHSHATTPATSWFALGFSDRGDLPGADLCIGWTDRLGKVSFQSALVDEDGRLVVSEFQVCENFRYAHKDNGAGDLKFTFTRKLDTCRPGHYTFQRGTTHIVWSRGVGPLYNLGGVLAKGDETGMVRVEVLKPNHPKPNIQDEQAKALEFIAPEVQIPGEKTTYWCVVQKLPEEFVRKQHVLQIGPVIDKRNQDLVHHMHVYHCEYPKGFVVPYYEGPCLADDRAPEIDACKLVLAAWSMGTETMHYPKEAGLPMGGPDYNLYVMMELHYNNPMLKQGRVDSSGFRFHYTENLRQYDVGIMELGLEYSPKMAIPPQMDSFVLSGYCVPSCTALGLPPGGIYMFASQMHSHSTGIGAWTKHYRGHQELPEFDHDYHYSTYFQEIRMPQETVHVLPGDVLVMSCDYATMSRPNITLGGFTMIDEMCVNYVSYYPKMDLEVCKSSIDTSSLEKYFAFMKRMELQATSEDLGSVENYRAIEWTPLRSSLLHDLYESAPLSVQCQMSSGDRFPGYWENITIPRVTHPLPVKRKCNSPQE